jgi:Fur family transcriptional regulator, ferric uptake regulator
MSAIDSGRPRATKQRAAISDVLDRAGGFRSAQDIYDILRTEGSKVGLTTVYRTLQMLVDAGEVDVLRPAEGEAVYRRCASEGHHHHLICRSCGSSVEIEGDEVEAWASAVGTRHGFTSVTHVVEVFGICKACASA